MNRPPGPRHPVVAMVAALVSFAPASGQNAPTMKVMISGGFTAAYQELVPEFERKTGYAIETAYGGSMGNAPTAIPNRLLRGESADVVILANSALEELLKRHQVIPGTQVDLARSIIAMAVREGEPKPDISTLEKLKHTLLVAKSIAYSDSVSGVYLSTELFPRLGIANAIRGKSIAISVGMVGTAVARGDAEIGFQQLSELLPIRGIDIVGPIPVEAQKVTLYSGGVVVSSKQPAIAKQFLRFLASPEAAAIVKKSGMQPASEHQTTKSSSKSETLGTPMAHQVALERCAVHSPYRTTSTSLTLSRARKNLIDAKSRNSVSICRLLNTRCKRNPSVTAVWTAPVGPRRVSRRNTIRCISSVSLPTI